MHRAASDLSRIQALGVRFTQADLGDLDELRQAVSGHDAVIHAAAARSRIVEDLTRTNVAGTANVARACRLEGVGRMLHMSSTAAIGIPYDPHQPADESFRFNLEDTAFHYQISKKRGEGAVLAEVSAGLDAVIVNPAFIFGPHGSGYRGGDLIRKIANRRLVSYFRGGLCIVHVADVVHGTLAALERGERGARYILGGENISHFEIARRSLDALHLRRPMIAVPAPVSGALAWTISLARSFSERRPRFDLSTYRLSFGYHYYCSSKARAELGYESRGFSAILAELLSMDYLARR